MAKVAVVVAVAVLAVCCIAAVSVDAIQIHPPPPIGKSKVNPKLKPNAKPVNTKPDNKPATNTNNKPKPNTPTNKPTPGTNNKPPAPKPGGTPGGAGGGGGGGGGGSFGAGAANSTPAGPNDLKKFNEPLMEFLNKYKGCVEGSAKFKELFPKIEQDRKNTPGYTTCVTFQNLAIGYASQKSHMKLSKNPSVIFFDAQNRKKNKIPPNSFFAAWGGLAAGEKDKTATYVDLAAKDSPRPAPGDLFLLAFNKAAGKMQPGYFSHIGFVTEIKKLDDGKEEWTTVAGGGGSARSKQEAVTEGKMIIDPKTGLTGPVANQPGSNRRLQGWISVAALLQK